MPYRGERVLDVKKLYLETVMLCSALQVPEAQLAALFKDGSFVSRVAECWAAQRFGFKARPSRNTPTPDRVVMLTERGVAFSQSKTRGMGRQGSTADLQQFLNGLNRLVVVDITRFPTVTMWEVNLPVLLQFLVNHGGGGTMSYQGFWDWQARDWVAATALTESPAASLEGKAAVVRGLPHAL